MINVTGTNAPDYFEFGSNINDPAILEGVNIQLLNGEDSVNTTKIQGAVIIKATDGSDDIYLEEQQGTVDITLGAGGSYLNDVHISGNDGNGPKEGAINVTGNSSYDSLSVMNSSADLTASLGDSDDGVLLYRTTGKSTLMMGAGNDSVQSQDSTVHGSIYFGTGQDSLWLHGNSVATDLTLNFADGGDFVQATASGAVNITLGNKSVELTDKSSLTYDTFIDTTKRIDNFVTLGGANPDAAGQISVTGGNGGDVVLAEYIASAALNLGDGDDQIICSASGNATINSGNGNDKIRASSDTGNIQVDLGTGNDLVNVDTGSTNTVKASDGGDVIEINGRPDINGAHLGDATIILGSGGGVADKGFLQVQNALGPDPVFNNIVYGSYAKSLNVTGGTGNDAITAFNGYDITVKSGAGDDVISVGYADKAFVDAGEGNDHIISDNVAGLINAGAGADRVLIQGYAEGMTVDLGASGAAQSGNVSFRINAYSSLVNGVGGHASIYAGGKKIGEFQSNNTATTGQDFTVTTAAANLLNGEFAILFDNDAYIAATSTTPAQDRNLYIREVEMINPDGSKQMLWNKAMSTDSAVVKPTYDRYNSGAPAGVNSAFDGQTIQSYTPSSAGTISMAWGGALKFNLDTQVSGIDIADGGNGSDTYLFDRNSGRDLYRDTGTQAGDVDVLKFAADVKVDQIWLSRDAQAKIHVGIIGTNNDAVINDVDQLQAGGKTLAAADFDKLIQAMASVTPPSMGQLDLNTTQHQKLDAVIAANWH